MRRLRLWLFALGESSSLWLYPELRFYDTSEQRADFWSTTYRAFLKRRGVRFFLRLVGLSLLIQLPCTLALWPARPYLQLWLGNIGASALTSGLAGGLFGGAFLFILRRTMRGELRAALRARGFKPCMHCGYDLRGLATGRCPECGTADGSDSAAVTDAGRP